METLDSNGNQTHSLVEMKERAIAYFSALYVADPRPSLLPNLNITIACKPSIEENAKLRAFPSEEEIWNSLKSMPKGI